MVNEAIEVRRKRLLHRCRYTGMKETDLLLGAFATKHGATLDMQGLDELEALLDAGDPSIHAWVVSGLDVPAKYDNDTLRLIKAFKVED